MRQSAFLIVLAGLGLLVVSSGFCFAEVQVALSQWAAARPKLDGLAEEWPPDSVLHEKKMDLDYGFKNDDRNLYILLVFRNPKFLSSIETLGILISAGLEGTKNNGSAVRFVKKTITADQYISLLESRGASPTDEEREKLRRQSRHPVFAAYAVDKKGKNYCALRGFDRCGAAGVRDTKTRKRINLRIPDSLGFPERPPQRDRGRTRRDYHGFF